MKEGNGGINISSKGQFKPVVIKRSKAEIC